MKQVLGAGGFGIVYLAMDHSLMRLVAVKEYVPFALATRGAGPALTLRSTADAEPFAAGLRSFINEARLLASFDHPSLVKVYRFWEQNGTAYMAMPYYAGQTLKDARRRMGRAPDEAWLQDIVQALLGALEVLHAQRIYHRDISPDNIMLLPDGRPVLLDFGSARRVAGDSAQGLTAILKPSFAPVEQYADMAQVPQGPWTDLYALGAVVYFMLKGEPPVPSVVRSMQGGLPLLCAPDAQGTQVATSPFLSAVEWALAVHPQDRPQDVTALRNALSGDSPAPAAPHTGRSIAFTPTAITSNGFWATTVPDPMPSRPPIPPSAETAATAPQGRHASRQRKAATGRGMVAIAALAVCAATLAAWQWSRQATAQPAVPTAASRSEPIPAPPTSATAKPEPQAAASRAAAAAPVSQGAAPSPTTPAISTAAWRQPKPPRGPEAATQRPDAVVKATALDGCADKNFLMKAVCVRRACQQPQLRMHAQCLQLRAEDEARVPPQSSH